MASSHSDPDPRQPQAAYPPPEGPPFIPNPNVAPETRSHAPQGGAPYLPPPPPGQQANPQYPPYYAPPPQWYSGAPGYHPVQYGNYPPPPGAPPTGQIPTGAPTAGPPAGNYFPGGPIAQFPGAAHYPPGDYPAPPVAPVANYWYLGTPIPDPHAPRAPHGVQKVPGYDPALTYNSVVKAIDGGHDSQLSDILLPLDIFKMDALCDYAIAKTGKSLQDLIMKKNNSFRVALCALTQGPLGYDAELAHKALVGLGTNEILLTELILGRSVAEIRLLIEGYQKKYNKDLVSDVKSDLSGKIESMFVMALNGQRPPEYLPVDHKLVDEDIETLNKASKKKDEVKFFEILINRSNVHIAAVVTGFAMRYKSLSKVIKKTFSGHMEFSLLFLMHGAKSKRDGQGCWRDAKLMEKSMAGLGTRDAQLIYRIVRAHWNPDRLEAIKSAYKQRYGKPLEARVKGETSGDYQKLLVAIIKSSETTKV